MQKQKSHIYMENGVRQIVLAAKTVDVKLDKTEKSRSFQNTEMTYLQIINQLLSQYQGEVYCKKSLVRTGIPVIQYNETDWCFLKRMAGYAGLGVFCDETAEVPGIKLGLPDAGKKVVISMDHYKCQVNEAYYHGWRQEGVPRAEFLYYEVESEENYAIGDYAFYKGQNQYIFEKHAEWKGGRLLFRYKMGGQYYFRSRKIFNEKLTGAALSGRIVRTDKETAYIKLDIDGNNGQASYPYPWSPVTGNLLYSMPQPGTKGYLYFPDCHEERAFAGSSTCTIEEGSRETQEREFGTEHGKCLQMYADCITLKGGRNTDPQELSLGKSSCILEAGDRRLTLTAADRVTFIAPSIIIRTPLEINQLKNSQYARIKGEQLKQKGSRNPDTGGDASLTMQYEFNGLAGQGVLEGTEYEKYVPFEDEPEYEWNPPTWLKVISGMAAAQLVAASAGSLLIMTAVIKKPDNALDMIKRGVLIICLGSISGAVSTYATAIRNAEDGETSSLGEYFARAINSTVTLEPINELIPFLQTAITDGIEFNEEFRNTVDKLDVLKVIAFLGARFSNEKIMLFLNLLSFKGVDQDTILYNKVKNRFLLRAQYLDVNKRFFIPGEFIENQSKWETIKYGSTTMKAAGCEIMATYNALLALGEDMPHIGDMVDLISDFEEHGAELGGEFGSTPASIINYFRRNNYIVDYTLSKDPDIINRMGEDSDTIIITVFNSTYDASNMIHTVNVTKDENGEYTLHNGSMLDYSAKKTLQEIIDNMSQGSAAVICVIGISKPVDMQE